MKEGDFALLLGPLFLNLKETYQIMAEAIRMPLLSDTMKEGVIAAWHKNVGDTVKADEAIADVETDKATMEVMPYVDGTLLYVGAEPGKAVPVNGIMAIIGKPGEEFQSLLDGEKSGSGQLTGDAPKTSPVPETEQEGQNASKESVTAAATQAPAGGSAGPAPLPKDVTVVRMPLLSDTMTEGKIVAWHKKVGDAVKGDDVLADVETDKATMEVMGYADGTLLHVGVEEGSAAKVNGIIAIVGPAGTDIQGILSGESQSQSLEAKTQNTGSNGGEAQANSAQQPAAPATEQSNGGVTSGGRIIASPLAKRLAEEKGIDLNQVKGSGDGGRIVKRDVDQFQPSAQQATPATSQAPAASAQAGSASAQKAAPVTFTAGQEGHQDRPNSQMRGVIAKRLSESMFTAPHFYLRITVTMDKAIEAREALNAVSPVKISFNDLTIKAAAMALRRHPDVNSSWMGNSIRTYQHVHVGTAVAIEDGGLIVPVVKFADQKSLSQIATDTKDLIGKVRSKRIQPAEFTGNTFTISNLGMMDIDEFTAIINPPDACILAVGKIAATPVVENGQVVVRQLMKLTLSCDHRVVDGAVGAQFLQSLKGFLENPVTMLV